MDKIYFLLKRADAGIDCLSTMLNDDKLIGSPDSCVITGYVDSYWMKCSRRADLV